MRTRALVLAALLAAGGACRARCATDPALPLARGSLAAAPPAGEPTPPAPAFVDPALGAPIPTNRWWSSLVALPFSERQYPHPLAVLARAEGLQIRYPGPDISAGDACICGWMEPEPANDLVLAHGAVPRFDEARLAGWSDWFVRARFAAKSAPEAGMEVSYGHGSPFVFATFRGGDPVVRFPAPPEVFHEGDGTLGVCRDRRCYLLVGPPGTRWSGAGGAELALGGAARVAIALLPDGQRGEAVERFARAAREPGRARGSIWTYDEARARVQVRFRYGGARTLFALYPHQRAALAAGSGEELGTYASVRGRMSLRAGDGFGSSFRFRASCRRCPCCRAPTSTVSARS